MCQFDSKECVLFHHNTKYREGKGKGNCLRVLLPDFLRALSANHANDDLSLRFEEGATSSISAKSYSQIVTDIMSLLALLDIFELRAAICVA